MFSNGKNKYSPSTLQHRFNSLVSWLVVGIEDDTARYSIEMCYNGGKRKYMYTLLRTVYYCTVVYTTGSFKK